MKKQELKSPKYIEDIVAETGQLVPAFRMAYKNGDTDAFLDFINKNKLQESLLENAFDGFLELYHFDEEKKCYMKLIEDEGLRYLSSVYGERFGKKLEPLYKAGKINAFDICQLVELNRKENVAQQSDIMCQILDLCNDDTLAIGIHRTGGKGVGERINETGLMLTGHISSGVDSSQYTDIYSKLEENITFSENHVGMLMQMIATGGNYKNYMGNQFVDISIIAIPKKDLQEEKDDIIIKRDGLSLNPKYIKGYITVDANDNTMARYVKNPRYIDEKKDIKESSTKNSKDLLAEVVKESKKQLGFSEIKKIVQKIKTKIQDKVKKIGEEFDGR